MSVRGIRMNISDREAMRRYVNYPNLAYVEWHWLEFNYVVYHI
jgi:hypothetical protein